MNKGEEILREISSERYEREFPYKFCMDACSTIGISLDIDYEEIDDLALLERYKDHEPPTGWRAEIYSRLKSGILKPVVSLFAKDEPVEEILGTITGIFVSHFGSRGIPVEQEVAEPTELLIKEVFDEAEFNRNDPKSSVCEIAKSLLFKEHALFAKGYAKGLETLRDETGNLRNEQTNTIIYYSLLYFAEYIDYLKTRKEVVEFLRKLHGEELLHDDEALIKTFKRIGLKSRK